ncbi:MAG: hypothetical protein A2V90_04170 [Gammaproteobacteria bacterium RBG_16_57_12]|nr:MAG: hypothetical protein A2V90_04170 [Gammaproteobacteria bacterium RBG_16_57_12]
MRASIKIVVLFLLLISVSGCSTPPDPPEVGQAQNQELLLWRAGTHIFLQNEYSQYTALLKQANESFVKERAQFALFINYENITAEYGRIISFGNSLKSRLDELKQTKSDSLSQKISDYQDRVSRLKQASMLVNEGRLARKSLTQAELIFAEVSALHDKGDLLAAEQKIESIFPLIKRAESSLAPIIGRYSDEDQIRKWRNWVDSTIVESKNNQSMAIVVNKIKKTLLLYKSGRVVKSYPVELGRNGAKDKLYAGDQATPEGKYKVVKKNPNSKYHMALLINYPNDDDVKAFRIAKKNGLVPRKAGIGSLIEIHGGGDDSMTLGCVSMKNSEIEELYHMVEVGTPVTIVGAVEVDNLLSDSMSRL